MDFVFWGFVVVGLGILSVITLLQQQNKRDKLRQQRELREKREIDRKSAPCPECAESILVDAKRCKHCQADVAAHMEPFREKLLKDPDGSRFSAASAQFSQGRRTSLVMGWGTAAISPLLLVAFIIDGDPTALIMFGVLGTLAGFGIVQGRKLQNQAAAQLAELETRAE